MDRQKELALRARLRKLQMFPPDDLISALVQLEEELDDVELLLVLETFGVFPDDDSSDFGLPVRQPVKPRPSLNSGAIALPNDPELPAVRPLAVDYRAKNINN